MAKQRFKLKLTKLDFVSAVDMPAQSTATVAIIKRDGATWSATCSVVKVDDEVGVVMGFAFTSTVDGKPFYDSQGDAIDESDVVKIADDFASSGAKSDEMHDERPSGVVKFIWPLTGEIAKSLDIQTKRTGLLVGIKPSADVLAKFKSGEYSGFSIGGSGVRTPVEKQTKCAKCDSYVGKDDTECPSCGAPMEKRLGKAVWPTADVDNLPDSAFLHVEPGGKKADGKTTPRSNRMFPYRDAAGKIDIPHLRDAIGRIPQSSLPATEREELQQRAEKLLAAQHGESTDKRAGNSTHSADDRNVTSKAKETTVDPKDAQIVDLTKRAERAEKLATLTDAQRAYHAKLSASDAEAFIAKSVADRDAAVKAAIVYTAKSGKAYFDADQGALAKQLDEQADELAKARDAATDADVEKRAAVLFEKLAGDGAIKKRVLKAIDREFTDAKERAAVVAMFKAAGDAMDRLFKASDHKLREGFELPPNGATETTTAIETAAAALRKHVEKYQADHKIATYQQALSKALREDPKAGELYAATRN